MKSTIDKLDASLRHAKAKLDGLDTEIKKFTASGRLEDQIYIRNIKKHRLHLKDKIKRLEEQISSLVGAAEYTRPALA